MLVEYTSLDSLIAIASSIRQCIRFYANKYFLLCQIENSLHIIIATDAPKEYYKYAIWSPETGSSELVNEWPKSLGSNVIIYIHRLEKLRHPRLKMLLEED